MKYRMPSLTELKSNALKAAKVASRWAYHRHYVGGDETITVREPDTHTLYLTGLRSWDYAKQFGCSTSVARAHLRKLVAAGMLNEQRRCSVACDFKLLHDDAVAIGREIIAELQAEGLPFEDEWRAAQAKGKAA